jgi:cytochrome c oxidase assembly protein subunit 15
MEQYRSVRVWLWTCAVLVGVMVLVGGITRLTGSGLSITEWKVVTGVFPPLTETAWQETFAHYQASPQFLKQNTHFELSEFKNIFWWEWFHRLLGRVVGLVFLVPWLYFVARRKLSLGVALRGGLLVIMVVLQGILGWLMVKSGLVDEPRVSHFRLAAHLMMAIFTMSLAIWTALSLGTASTRRAHPSTSGIALIWGFMALLGVQLIWGAFVAGLRAGLFYPSFPKMGDDWMPESVARAGFSGLLVHPASVQWGHRWLAVLVAAVGVGVLVRFWPVVAARRSLFVMGTVLCLQFILGVLTVLFFVQHSVVLGALHQTGAVVLVWAALVAARRVTSALPVDGRTAEDSVGTLLRA